MSTLKVKYNNQWQEVGATGSALAGIAENVEVLNAKVDSIPISNPNLLDNGWFTVNQRGESSYTGTGAYCVDRWKRNNSFTNVEVTSTGITISSSASATTTAFTSQPLELSRFEGASKVTISIKYADGHIETATGDYNGLSTSILTRAYQGSLIALMHSASFYADNLMLLIRTDFPSISTSIRAIKVELGSKSTLAYDSAPDYATELLKCQRYYYRFHGVVTGAWITSDWLRFSVPIPVRMRSTTRVVTYSSAQFHYGGSWHGYGSTTGMTLSEIQFKDCVLISVTGVSSTAYNASLADLEIGISADL